MKNLLTAPEYEFYEPPITLSEAKGHQYLGYLDLSSLVMSQCGCYASLGMIDASNQYLTFTIQPEMLFRIKRRLSLIQFDAAQHLFIWIEMTPQGEVTNERAFQIQWTLETLIDVYQKTYHFESLYQLITLVQNFKTPALKQFCIDLIQDIPLMRSWVTLPASQSHHHAYPGGLLEHSIECAMIVKQNTKMLSEMSLKEQEITTLAALLHDIGKTRTINQGRYTSLGSLVDHELLTLQVLAKPLERFAIAWSQGAECLQYLLTWKINTGFCKFIGGNIIKLADHISTSASLRQKAFQDKPDYFNFASIEVSNAKKFINRLN